MVQLRRLTRRVSLQHAPTFTRDEIGRPIPNWATYAMPVRGADTGLRVGVGCHGPGGADLFDGVPDACGPDGSDGPAAD